MLEEQMRWLLELQKADSKLMELQRLQTELPLELERISQEIQRGREQVENARKSLDELKLRHRQKESDLEVGIEQVKKAQRRLFEVKTNKEYQALLKEMESAKGANGQLEEEILLLMEKMDACTTDLQRLEEERQGTERELLARREAIQNQVDGLNDDILDCQRNREEVGRQIDPTWMARYDRIAQRNNGLAVVRVEGGICQGCFLNIPPQLYNEILKSGPVVQCPFCMRFIYHESAQVSDQTAGIGR